MSRRNTAQPRQAAAPRSSHACFVCVFRLKVIMLQTEDGTEYPGPLPTVAAAITLAPIALPGMDGPGILPVCLEHFPASDQVPSSLFVP
jgi:hypothetical protein